jgi:pimeloyl-ACP methyl ester carboxylesterase
VKVKDIAMTNDGNFTCPKVACAAANTRAQWFANTPGTTLPQNTYFYQGAKTEQTLGAGLFRAITRNALFAGGPVEPMDSLRTPAKQQMRVNFGYMAPATTVQEEVCLHLAEDDVTLYGRYGSPQLGNTAKVILVLSGSGGVAADYCGEIVRGYKQLNYAALSVDYRGFGRSTGCASSRGTYSDAEAMYAFLRDDPGVLGKGYQIDEVVLHGYSLGSGPATELALRLQNRGTPAAGLILHCPMDSARTNFREQAPNGLKSFAGKMASWGHAYNNIGKIGQINCPILIIKGLQDDMRPQADNLRQAKPTAQLVSYNGDHHDRHMIFLSGDIGTFLNGL